MCVCVRERERDREREKEAEGMRDGGERGWIEGKVEEHTHTVLFIKDSEEGGAVITQHRDIYSHCPGKWLLLTGRPLPQEPDLGLGSEGMSKVAMSQGMSL